MKTAPSTGSYKVSLFYEIKYRFKEKYVMYSGIIFENTIQKADFNMEIIMIIFNFDDDDEFC